MKSTGAAFVSVDLSPDKFGSEVNCVASSPPSREHGRGMCLEASNGHICIEEVLFGEAGIKGVFFTDVSIGGVGIEVGLVGLRL